MKKFGLLATMIFVSSLFFTGCGNSSNDNGIAEDEDGGPIVVIPPVDGGPIVVIPPVDGGDTGGDTAGGTGDSTEIEVNPGVNPPPVPPETDSNITGTTLGGCDTLAEARVLSTDAVDFNKSYVNTTNVSTPTGGLQDNRHNATNNNVPKRLSTLVKAKSRSGDVADVGTDGNLTHPIIVSYQQQVVGDYELGDASADIPDPDQRDALFVGVSYDNGATWKNTQLSHSENTSSIEVEWNGVTIPYNGHVQKPTMAVQGNHILIAYHDKFCPSRNPLNLEQNLVTLEFETDYFATVGNQGTIDYEGLHIEFNDKYVYEAPFSCVWTVRGIFNEDPVDGIDYNITWHKPMQLTSGMRDSNKIAIAASKAGFAIAWQEDPEGLRAGDAKGPGEGWSGATTNHGADIWYSSIKMDDFNKSIGIDDNITSEVPMNYPVRITDNEICQPDDNKIYCQEICNIGEVTITTTNNNKTDSVTRCYTHDTDWLLTGAPDLWEHPDLNDTAVLDGDTGASRPAISIIETDEGESVVLLGYEETKGLSLSQAAAQDQDQGTSTTNVELEGKSVYFESFNFNAIDDFNASVPDTMFNVAMPLVSAGDIINVRVPDQNNTDSKIYENARRLVIGTQVDACDVQNYTFAILYKQSYDTQGASSDMFVRVNNGLTYDSFIALPSGHSVGDLNVTNVSAQDINVSSEAGNSAQDYVEPSWSEFNLIAQTYDNDIENTYSPRIFLRGDNIFTGYAYTPDDTGNFPSNFHPHVYMNGVWQGPENVSKLIQGHITSEDPRFIPTPKALANTLPSDASNPNVLWVSWGTINTDPAVDAPEGIYFKRGIFDGTTWNWDENATKIADREGALVQESAVQVLATPDGKTLHNVWVQEVEEAEYDLNDPFHGLDTWYGRVDINETE